MIDVLIFSKNRACQLDLLLRSIRDNFGEIEDIHIVCVGSNPEFNQGYIKLFKKFPDYLWRAEQNLIEDVKEIVNGFQAPYAMTLVDDEIVIRDHSIQPMLDILGEYDNIHCASVRMGRNIGDYCYTADIQATIPEFDAMRDGSGVYRWDWSTGDGRVDWYYPSCINSHIYYTDFLKHWINNIQFGNVNDLEGILNTNRETFKKYMICMDKSKTINIANNISQSGYNRHSDKQEFTLENLNKKFLEGYVIDEKDFYNIENDIATYEKDYVLIKE